MLDLVRSAQHVAEKKPDEKTMSVAGQDDCCIPGPSWRLSPEKTKSEVAEKKRKTEESSERLCKKGKTSEEKTEDQMEIDKMEDFSTMEEKDEKSVGAQMEDFGTMEEKDEKSVAAKVDEAIEQVDD